MAEMLTCIRCSKQYEEGRLGRSRMCRPCSFANIDESKTASRQVRRAIRRGEMERADAHSCVDCGKQARDYDHRDYLKPLDVVPVCRGCNVRRGTALDSVLRSIPAREVA